MKKSTKLHPKRSLKGFFLIQAVVAISLLYYIGDNVTQVNHVDNIAKIIVQPREHIKQASNASAEAASYTRKELFCLAQNIFFEARGTDLDEKIRVANVTLNRVKSQKYSDNVCSVVYEPYQFSWTLQNKNLKAIISKNKIERQAWEESVKVAEAQLNNDLPDLTNGAMFYHTHAVKPTWSRVFRKTVKSQWHQYYKL